MTPLNLEEFLERDFPRREMLLAPWLPTQGLCMLYGPRGLGKTFVSVGISLAVATGGTFLGWTAPQPRRVLHIDGEMPAASLQERFAHAIKLSGEMAMPSPDYLHVLSAEIEPDGLPDLADPAGQAFYEPYLAGADLIVVDNISTVCRGIRENESDSWRPVQEWTLRMRRAGRAVLLNHHSGKSGDQRGTSKKEDVLDTVIALRRPADYGSGQGARFEVYFEKARGFFGPDAEPFQAHLMGDGWAISDIINEEKDEVLRLKAAGKSCRQIADETGRSKSAVGRILKGVNHE
jgi:putative DNA primase/helicase